MLTAEKKLMIANSSINVIDMDEGQPPIVSNELGGEDDDSSQIRQNMVW